MQQYFFKLKKIVIKSPPHTLFQIMKGVILTPPSYDCSKQVFNLGLGEQKCNLETRPSGLDECLY